jgi:hypothetical protein
MDARSDFLSVLRPGFRNGIHDNDRGGSFVAGEFAPTPGLLRERIDRFDHEVTLVQMCHRGFRRYACKGQHPAPMMRTYLTFR